MLLDLTEHHAILSGSFDSDCLSWFLTILECAIVLSNGFNAYLSSLPFDYIRDTPFSQTAFISGYFLTNRWKKEMKITVVLESDSGEFAMEELEEPSDATV